MPQSIHVLVPMSGQGTRYQKAGYTEPKPLIPVNGIPMIQRLMENFPEKWPTTFVMAQNHQQTDLPVELSKIRPHAKQLYVPEHSRGPGIAILEGLKQIPDDAPVLVTYCDYAMVWDSAQFARFVSESDCDSCLISYRGFHAHYLSPQMYAYSRMDGEQVREVREKGGFTADRETEYASTGGYYFRTAALLKQSLEFQIQNNLELNGELYTSLTVEALLRMNPASDVRVFEIPGFFQWGTPQDLQTFEYWEKTFQSYSRFAGRRSEVDQLLMPMAGAGSRFLGVADRPKPFIHIGDVPMARRALNSLPKARDQVSIIALESHQQFMGELLVSTDSITYLKETPPGQALSTEAGLKKLKSKGDIIVSSCDHGIVLDPSCWAAFRLQPDCDAAIFTVESFPGTLRRPTAFAYVKTEKHGAFPIVTGVSVKQPISENPGQDPLLVGTFWFRNQSILAKGIELVKARSVTVNGELYLDSCFELLMNAGHKVRTIPLSGYINWGDPDSLAEALYWQEIFTGRRIDRRLRFPGVKIGNG